MLHGFDAGKMSLLPRIAVAAAIVATAAPAFALPTMIRLGYSDCVSCHISPQGGGLLNIYGRGIDEAQSLRAGEYRPSESPLVKALSLRGRIMQDLRAVVQEQASWTGNGQLASLFWPRLMYRNVTDLGNGFRLSATITGEIESLPRPPLTYDRPPGGSPVFVNTALVHYRANDTLEFAAGRDQLPSGVNIPDLGVFIRSRNRLGYYDVPTQLKMFLGNKRYQVFPFVFAPGGNDPSGEGESGVGTIAELDVLGSQRSIVGISLLHGSASLGDRTMVGVYARLGFGKWGVLAEHDFTDRARDVPAVASFGQHATYGHVFWAPREWLVASAIAERLRVEEPFEEQVNGGRLEIATRFMSQFSLGLSARVAHDLLTSRTSKVLVFQASLKTVN